MASRDIFDQVEDVLTGYASASLFEVESIVPQYQHDSMTDMERLHLEGLAMNAFKRKGELVADSFHQEPVGSKCQSEHPEHPSYSESYPHYHYRYTARVILG